MRTNLTAEEKEAPPRVNESMEKYQGCIGIVCTKCTSAPGIFFQGPNPPFVRFWWNNKWFSVLEDKDIAVLDAGWLAGLRDAFQKEFPDAVAVVKPQRTFAIGDSVRVRTDISDAEKTVVGPNFNRSMNTLIGKSGTIHAIDQDGDIRITFSHIPATDVPLWWWHPSWLEPYGTEATKKRSVAALKEVETDLDKIVLAVDQIKKKIKL